MKNLSKLLLLLVLCAGADACVTQKKKGAETSKAKKGYHNLTSKYNYWFNADELFRLTVDKMNQGYQDNYNKIL
ncbi:MAG: hypothetical protein KGS48_05790, partial [Bacteroidetes bacterium]|nr:hypothetical protein [Bacteroidota bacterium]